MPKKKVEPLLTAVSAALLAAFLPGCISRAWVAQRVAAKMLNPATSPRKSLRFRQRLIALAPESEEYLADAFFPIGLYDVPEAALQRIAQAGFNLVLNGGKDARYLDRAGAAGLRVIPYIRLDRMREEVERAGARRALYAWYLFDEPDLNRMAPEEYARLAAKLRKLDRRRPIYLTVFSPRRYDDFVSECDVFAPNPYPIRRVEPEANELRHVGLAVDLARQAAGSRPVWAILQTFWAEPWWPRNPTPAELRAMVFMALNHGADGIVYFSYKSGDRAITEHAELFEEIERINGRLRALRGALLVKPLPDALRVEPILLGGEPLRQGPLDVSLRRFGEALLLIAVNPDPWPRHARIFLPEWARAARSYKLFDADIPDPIRIAGESAISLSFEPYQVHVLWIERARALR